jgi:hypothetical protein
MDTHLPVKCSHFCTLSIEDLKILKYIYYRINYSHVFNSSFVVLMEKCHLKPKQINRI